MNADELYLNQAAQGVHTAPAAAAWFRERPVAARREVLERLHMMVGQAHPREAEVHAAIARVGERAARWTPGVLLAVYPLTIALRKIVALPEDELERAFALLMSLFIVADAARRASTCMYGCSHWWHRDLGDPAVLASLSHGPGW